MIKHTSGDLVYYFTSREHYDVAISEAYANWSQIAVVMQRMAVVIINTRTNEVIKVRFDWEEFIDFCLGDRLIEVVL